MMKRGAGDTAQKEEVFSFESELQVRNFEQELASSQLRVRTPLYFAFEWKRF